MTKKEARKLQCGDEIWVRGVSEPVVFVGLAKHGFFKVAPTFAEIRSSVHRIKIEEIDSRVVTSTQLLKYLLKEYHCD